MQITGELSPPELCDNCCSINIELVKNERIYGRVIGDWPWIWICNDCGAAVGCHPLTNKPLGKMADRVTRTWRKKAHEAFDGLWKNGLMSRSKAYTWLAYELQINPNQCHISWLSKDQLKDVINLTTAYLATNSKALLKRQQKKVKKENERRQRSEPKSTKTAAYRAKKNKPF